MTQKSTIAELQSGWNSTSPGPATVGRVCLIVTRGSSSDMPSGQNKLTTPLHKTPLSVAFSVNDGVLGDRWKLGKTPGSQISLTSLAVAKLIGGEEARWHLFGDNFVVDLDLGLASLPIGSRLALGSGEIEISEEVHSPCDRYKARFGAAAFQWVDDPALAERCLRGRYAQVIRSGSVSVGNEIRVISH